MGEFIEKLRKKFKTSELPESCNDDLETLEEYKSRWRSIRIIYYTMFLMSLGFSIILTGIWPYLDKLDPHAGKEFMGLIVAANPLGQMIFSPLFGFWSNKSGSIRIPLLCSLALFTFASILYSSLDFVTSYVKYWMLISRFLIGVSSANIAVCRSYLSEATRLDERTGAVSMISLAQVLGFIIGPALQAAVTFFGDDGFKPIPGVVLNMYTASGWINVIMSIMNFIFFLPFMFQEHKIATREVMKIQGKATVEETWKSNKPNYFSAWTLISAFFVLVFNFVLLETLGTSLTMDQFAWTKAESLYYMGLLMGGGGIVACITFVMIKKLCTWFQEQKVLIWGGFALMVLGRLSYIPLGASPPKIAEVYNTTIILNENSTMYLDPQDEIYLGCPKIQEWCEYTPALTISQFLFGYALTSVGYPIGVTLIQTIFSKILGPRPQGVWMGLMTGSGCFSRVLGPVFVGSIYTRLGTYWTFGTTSLMMFLAMLWLWYYKDVLICPVYEKPSVEMKDMKHSEGELLQKQEVIQVEPNTDSTKADIDKCDETDELLKKQTVVQIREDLNKT
ncbi:MFSD8 family protein [Megaselia abdita]